MHISYNRYLDQILGGWIGKSIGGAIGARFEGYKGWIDIGQAELFPDKIPPNDDLDLQVLWLKVIEEKGAALTGDDLAEAWLAGCWYPFCEYGIFRRNYRLGIHPPTSGRFNNQFWDTGMGCPIRAEIWGYIFPGAPDLAAHYAEIDGSLDHTEQSIGAEKMFAAMASMAFFEPNVRRLISMFLHYLPKGSTIERLSRLAFESYDNGLSLRAARDRIMAVAGNPEAVDAQTNVPFTFLGLLYGEGDLEKTLISALSCGYDTDCTMATSAALLGQIMGARRIPVSLKKPIGDELVVDMEYHRPEMTITALARDTARMGVLLASDCDTRVEISNPPILKPLPSAARRPKTRLHVDYEGLPTAAPGDCVQARIHIEGTIPVGAKMRIAGPRHWEIIPREITLTSTSRTIPVALHAAKDVRQWPNRNLFEVSIDAKPALKYTFGVAGAPLWQFLGVYFNPLADEKNPVQFHRRHHHNFVTLDEAWLLEPKPNLKKLYREWSEILGRDPIIPAYEDHLDIARLSGLQGQYCAYAARTIICPNDRSAFIVIGNNDGYRLYLNGEQVGEMDEQTWWAPYNSVHKVHLRKGRNHLLVKLLKRGDLLRFTLAIRNDEGPKRHHGFIAVDYAVDLVDEVPCA